MHERALQVRAVAAALHAALERLGQWRGMAVMPGNSKQGFGAAGKAGCVNVLVNGTNRAVHLSFLPKIEPERKALRQGLIVGLYDHLLMVLLLHINSLVMMKSPHEGDHTSGPTIIRRGCGPAGPQSQMLLGDAINLATTVNLIAYTLVIGGQHYGHFDVLSPSFVLDGFCVSNKDESLYVQSHALCLYGDVAFAILLYGMVTLDKSQAAAPAVATIRPQLLGCVKRTSARWRQPPPGRQGRWRREQAAAHRQDHLPLHAGHGHERLAHRHMHGPGRRGTL